MKRRKHHRKARYNKKHRGGRRRKRIGSYARFVKSQWRSHRAKYARLGRRAMKAIAAAWRRRHPKKC